MMDTAAQLFEDENPPDEFTFGALCQLLDRLRRDDSPLYSDTVTWAKSVVSRIEPERCRLPFWPIDTLGQMTAANSGFWPILRSLGMEAINAFDWFPNVFSSAIPEQLPECLIELAVTIDDVSRALIQFKNCVLESLVINPPEEGSSEIWQSLPLTLRNLNWYGAIRSQPSEASAGDLQELKSPVRKLTARIPDVEEFRHCLDSVPRTLVEIGAETFAGEGNEKLEALCSTNRFASQLKRLKLTTPSIDDGRAKQLAKGAFSRLSSIDIVLAQPSATARSLFTQTGAEELVRASWWKHLEDLSIRCAYNGSVLTPLFDAISPRLRSLHIAQDDPNWNPHALKVGVNDEALLHIDVSTVAGLESLTLDCLRLRGSLLHHWVSKWPRESGGPRIVSFRTIPWDDYEKLGEFLQSRAVNLLEKLEISWPDHSAAMRLNIGIALSRSRYLEKLQALKLRGWSLTNEHVLDLIDNPAFARTLQELEISLDEKSDLVELVACLIRSPLGRGLRVLTILNCSNVDSISRVFENQVEPLPKLRSLTIQGDDCSIASLEHLARANCLQNLRNLALEGSHSTRHSVYSRQNVEASEAIRSLGTSRPLKNLYALSVKKVAGFDDWAVGELLNSPLVSGLYVLPEVDRCKSIWMQSEVLLPLARGYVESLNRVNANLADA